jgi:hypothetical protein
MGLVPGCVYAFGRGVAAVGWRGRHGGLRSIGPPRRGRLPQEWVEKR